MAITSVNYPAPVMVNGYPCKNCTDVDRAKAHIDPQHPSAGPYGVDASADPSLAGKTGGTNGAGSQTDSKNNVSFGGALSSFNGPTSSGRPSAAALPTSSRGSQLDLSA
jgi:hypothetical protein